MILPFGQNDGRSFFFESFQNIVENEIIRSSSLARPA